MIQIDELFRLRDVADDVELANRFLFRNFKCSFCLLKAFAFVGIFCPLAGAGEIFERLGVFDKYVHER